MKFIAPLLFVAIVLLPGCGNSAAKPSAFCQSTAAVKADVQALKALKGTGPSASTLETDLKQLSSDVKKSINAAKTAAAPQISALKSSITTLKSTISPIQASSDKKAAIIQALPTLKTQAEAVDTAWKSLTKVEKC